MNRREFLSTCAALGIAPRTLAFQQKPAPSAPVAPSAPANAWPQFRGSYALTGISSTTIAPAPKLAWAWEGGEAFDSSPAIVDDVVYAGTATGELIAVGLADGKLRWRYKAGEAIGESSPAVANGRVFIGDLIGVVHAVSVADGKPIWTFKTQSEIKSSPVVVGNLLLMGSYDGKLYGLDAATGKQVWAYTTENYVHGTPCVVNGVAHFAGCDEVFHAVDIKTGKERFAASATAYTGASVALVNNVAYFGTFDNEVLALDLQSRKVLWRYEHPDRKFPFYSSAAIGDGAFREEFHGPLPQAHGREQQDLGAPAFRSHDRDADDPVPVSDVERQVVPFAARVPSLEPVEHDQQADGAGGPCRSQQLLLGGVELVLPQHSADRQLVAAVHSRRDRRRHADARLPSGVPCGWP